MVSFNHEEQYCIFNEGDEFIPAAMDGWIGRNELPGLVERKFLSKPDKYGVYKAKMTFKLQRGGDIFPYTTPDEQETQGEDNESEN